MNKILGICNLHDSPSLGQLTKTRPLGALSFLSRYGLMDFTLSNFSNSDINRIVILTEFNSTAVHNHTRQGDVWINNTKTGFLRIIVNEKMLDTPKFNTDIANIEANYAVIQESNPDIIIVAPTFFLMSFDFRKMIEEHENSGVDVTCLYTKIANAKKNYINCDIFDINSKNDVTNCRVNNGEMNKANISLETFIFTREAFDRMLLLSHRVSSVYGIRKMVGFMINHELVSAKGYHYEGFVVPILSSQDYVEQSFNLLAYENRQKLFLEDWPIYTTTHNTPPSLYGKDASVKNSFVANGSIIRGKVENSIIFRDVVIEEGAVVKNCILFTKTHIGKDTNMSYVVTDKNVDISEVKSLHGTKDKALFVKQGEKI